MLAVVGAGGWPHLYRLEVSLGLLDHVTLGATAHYLASQDVPQWSPMVAVAAFRGRRIEAGVRYFQALYPPPKRDNDPGTPSFQERDHWLLTDVSVGNHWLSGGLDAGVVRAFEIARGVEPGPEGENVRATRWSFGGGVHLRAGTRRWGFTASVLAPRLYFDVAFDVRFGLFEARRKGGWRPAGVFYSTDRRVPRWR